MKLTLFAIPMLVISFSAFAQPGQNAWGFHHVINGKKFKSYKSVKWATKDLANYNKCVSKNSRRSNLKQKDCTKCFEHRGLILEYVLDSTYVDSDTKLLAWGRDVCVPTNDTLPVVYQNPMTYQFTNIGNLYLLDTIFMPKKTLKCNLTIVENAVAVDFLALNQPRTCFISSTTPIKSPMKFILPLRPRRTLGDVHRYARVDFRSWAMGLTVGTFRYRPKQDTVNGGNIPGTVAGALSLNVNFGYAFGFSNINAKRMTNYSAILGGFVGFSSVTINNTVVKNPSEWTKANDRINPAIAYGANIIFSRNNLGIVFSLGLDCNIGPNAKKWVYQNKPWFGIGLNAGLGIF